IRCDQSSSEPADAVAISATIGAATASATTPAAISHGFHHAGHLTATGAAPLAIEADSIDESAGRIALARDVDERRRIHLEITERGDDRIDRGAGLHGILEVRLRVKLLRIVRYEILEQPHRLVPVR